MAQEGVIIIKQGREKPVIRRHPWVFSGAIDTARTDFESLTPGTVVDVRDYRGGFLARGYYNPHSQIRARLLTWDQTEAMGAGWWRIRLARAIARRDPLSHLTDACRLVNAESDGLPGLIVDRYGEYLVIQILTYGVEVMKEAIVESLAALLKPQAIYERSDVDVREQEGLSESSGLLWGSDPPEIITITEHGISYPVDIRHGHKTGFYLDQRDSRHWLRHETQVAGAEVLNCFAYTGGFGICAALNGADSITQIDSSEGSLELARQAMAANNLAGFPAEYVAADVFDQLRAYREEERLFDVIILDPPKFAHNARQIESASRGYKDINWLAFQLLRPGGLLLTFSCSGHINADLFQKIVFGASVDAERNAQIIKRFTQPEDHPVLLSFPESEYLKGLACREI